MLAERHLDFPSYSKRRSKSPRGELADRAVPAAVGVPRSCTRPGAGKSPGHLSRWYNLTGFCLRPGFGDPVDRYRVEALWKLITAAASAHRHERGEEAAVVPEGGADYWIMWRRVSGGLNAALQQALFTRLRPALLPAKGKAFSPPAGERVRRDVARRREPRTARRQDQGAPRRRGTA